MSQTQVRFETKESNIIIFPQNIAKYVGIFNEFSTDFKTFNDIFPLKAIRTLDIINIKEILTIIESDRHSEETVFDYLETLNLEAIISFENDILSVNGIFGASDYLKIPEVLDIVGKYIANKIRKKNFREIASFFGLSEPRLDESRLNEPRFEISDIFKHLTDSTIDYLNLFET